MTYFTESDSMTLRTRRQGACSFALALAVALMALLTPALDAQTVALYSLNEKGRLSLNATLLDSLPGSKWVSLLVVGSDRYALKENGLVYKNGIKLYKLDCDDDTNKDVDEGDWLALVEVDGAIWALSRRGYLAKDGVCVTQLEEGDFQFEDLASGTSGTWSLRTDGAVFRDTTFQKTFAFLAGPGLDDAEEGEAEDTSWKSAAVGPDDKVYALRADGKIVRGDLLAEGEPISNGTLIASLVFGNTASAATLYADLVFTENGNWNVVRGNGNVFIQPNTLSPAIELNGTPNNGSGQRYVELLPLPSGENTTDMSFIALRRDGKLYRETDEAAVAQLAKSNYGCLELSLDAPDLTNFKNALPVVTTYSIKAITGTAFSFPILATDTDRLEADLIVTLDPETLPAGADYDSKSRTVSWASPVKGKYKIKVEVDDGVGKPVKKTFSVQVKDPSTNPDKNAKPRGSKIKNVQGLVGMELRLPIHASDPDGDDLMISVDQSKEPFTRGASFDQKTNTFIWADPELSDIGTYKLQFKVFDGTKTITIKVTVKIVGSILGF
jgi:hypothetical protein